MLKELPTSELIIILKTKNKRFEKLRIKNGKITTIDLKTLFDEKKSISHKENINTLTKKGVKKTSSEDSITSTKTYTEKIKGGFFGKRRSRF